MSLTELYHGQDGSLYKIERFSKNPIFFRYKELSREEIKELTGLQYSNTERNSGAGSNGREPAEPAANLGARTDTNDDIRGDDPTK